MNASGVKKPGGTAEETEKHFGCEASQLIMVDKNFSGHLLLATFL